MGPVDMTVSGMSSTLWAVRLGFFDLPALLFLMFRHGSLRVCYVDITSHMAAVLRLLGRSVHGRLESNALIYHLGETKTTEGIPLRFRADALTAHWAVLLAHEIREVWRSLPLPEWALSDRVRLYIERESKGLNRRGWHLFRLATITVLAEMERTEGRHYIRWPGRFKSQGIREDLQKKGLNPILSSGLAISPMAILSGIRDIFFARWKLAAVEKEIPRALDNNHRYYTAVQFAEGLDLSRRSELFWYPESRVDPETVVFYLNFPRYVDSVATINQIRNMGMSWVPLVSEAIPGQTEDNVWSAKPPSMADIRLSDMASGMKWLLIQLVCRPLSFLIWTAEILHCVSEQTWYWLQFLKEHKIGLSLYVDEGSQSLVGQDIAIDLCGGIQLHRQRSKQWMPAGSLLGLHHSHIHFVWGRHSIERLHRNRNRIRYCIITGFTYDHTFDRARQEGKKIRDSILESGGRFILCLYDNMFGNSHLSAGMMHDFYGAFLDWAEGDPTIGLVVKTKKPAVLEGLPDIAQRLNHFQESTGRCVVLDSKVQPAAAAFSSDFAVGIGISSAVTEAVLGGVRGIHCDLPGLRTHEFYDWGYERIIFDDIDGLILALKDYQNDPRTVPELGDFSPVIDDLDPFRDGRAGERAGQYMRLLQEGFKEGLDRESAMERANREYTEAWGEDKVVDMLSLEGINFLDNRSSFRHDRSKACLVPVE